MRIPRGINPRSGRGGHTSLISGSSQVPGLCLLLLLLPWSLPVAADEEEPCEVDDEDIRCFCNFTDPEPNWSSALQCTVAVQVEIRAGGRSLEQFLKYADTDPSQSDDMVKALRLRQLTVADAQVPARLLVGFLRTLGASKRLKELTFENLEVTGTMPPELPESAGPALSTLRLRNVSWAMGCTWLSGLQRLLKPGLKVLSVTRTPSSAPSSACELRNPFPGLTTLELNGHSFLGPQTAKRQGDPMNSGVGPPCATWTLALGLAGIAVLVRGPRA